MKAALIALGAGVLFGLGLCVSEMVNPARVIGFLDVAGAWDATLVFVMLAAVVIAGIGFQFTDKKSRPILADRFFAPERTEIDVRLIMGAVLFGLGWGLAGLCPGPAIAALASLSPSVAMFVGAMVAGQLIASRIS